VVKSSKNKPSPCPVTRTVNIIGGKWKPMIIYALLNESKRFNDLQRSIGNPSARILTLQLRELEEDKIIKREVYDQIPPKVEYSLTKRGRSLNEILMKMAEWGLEYS
jgi:DNA-binding HxlR family transcriptional regulator